jgi:hypothetical protein
MRRFTGVAAAAVALIIPATAAASVPPISFTHAAVYPTGQAFDAPSLDENGTATGDFLGNGRQDVVSVDQWEGDSVVIQYDNGNGTFSSPGQVITLPSFAVENVVTGVFTSSGRTDIVALTGTGFYLLRNNGGGSFIVGPFTQLEQVPFQDTAVAADFNRDGKLDLAIKTPTGIQVELGNGDGTFTKRPFTTIPGSFTPALTAIAVANVGGYGIADLFASDAVTQRVFALRGNGDGSFTETGSGLAPFVPGSVAVTNDTPNGLDSAVALDEFNAPGTSAALLVNNGNGGFEPAKIYNGGFNVASATSGDFNGDGIEDVVSDDTTGGNQVILAGDGNGGLVQAGQFATGINSQTPVVADFNGDGKPDIAVTTTCPGPSFLIGATCLAVLLNTSPS